MRSDRPLSARESERVHQHCDTPVLPSPIVPSDRSLKALNSAHRLLVRLSGGRLGWRAGEMPVVELTTIGRTTGLARTVMLSSPVQEGEQWVIVASRWGGDHHPAWFLNLRERPEVEVSLQGAPKRRMCARIAGPEERERLWPAVTKAYKGYAEYQQKTDREIPLVVLEPLS